jgi:hypothetical protein
VGGHSSAQRGAARADEGEWGGAIMAVEGQWRVRDNVCQNEEFRIRGMESVVPLTIRGVSREDGALQPSAVTPRLLPCSDHLGTASPEFTGALSLGARPDGRGSRCTNRCERCARPFHGCADEQSFAEQRMCAAVPSRESLGGRCCLS